MKKNILLIIFFSIFSQVTFSQKKADLTLNISPQFSKFDQVGFLFEFSNSFTLGVLYSAELGIFLPKGFKLNMSIGYSKQKNVFKYSDEYGEFFIKSNYRVFPIVLEYYFQIKNKNKITIFCGTGIQYKKKTIEDVEPYAGGLPNVIFLNKKSTHALIRGGINYKFNQNIFLKFAMQLDLPIFKQSAGNSVLIGTQLGLGIPLDNLLAKISTALLLSK